MFTLIAIGVGTAFLYSLIATLAPGLFPPTFKMHGMVPVYYEAAGVVVALVLLGQALEMHARASTGKAIRAFLDLAPKTARRIAADGIEAEVPLAEVIAGYRLRIRPGEAHRDRPRATHRRPDPCAGESLSNSAASVRPHSQPVWPGWN